MEAGALHLVLAAANKTQEPMDFSDKVPRPIWTQVGHTGPLREHQPSAICSQSSSPLHMV